MNKVVTFGEIMMRLSPEGYMRFINANKFNINYGGAEANVAVSLANFGVDVSFVTKLPTHQLGEAAKNELQKYGVDTKFIARGGNKLGIYFAEKGASQRPSTVIYDRNGTAIQEAKKNDFDWNKIFTGAKYFHFTGITPALSDSLAEICIEACKIAKAKNVTISADLNFRKKLWSEEKAKKVMTKLMSFVDICIANEEDAEKVFGIKAQNTEVTKGQIDKEKYISVAKQLCQKFNFKQVAITLRKSINATSNNWSALLYDGKKAYFSKEYFITLVDRIGGGDSFAAGLIYSNMMKFDKQKTIEFATSASCLKQTIEGDFNLVSLAEVEKLMAGDESGRITR